MPSITRLSYPIKSVWSAILSFFIFFPNTIGANYKDAQEHSTTSFAPKANVAINLHGSMNIIRYHNCLEYTEHTTYVFNVWGGCFLYGTLVMGIVFIIWYALGYYQEGLFEGGPARRQAGRTPAIAASCVPELPDDLDVPKTPPIGTNGTIGTTQTGRGRQFASQGSNSSQPPTPTSIPTSWDVKEPRSSDGRRIWMLPFAIGDWTQKNDPVDQEPDRPILSFDLPTARYPVQASFSSRANLRNQGSGASPLLKQHRCTPYPYLTNVNPRRSYRGSTLNIVETRLDRKQSSLEVSLYGNPRLLRPGLIVWFILVVAVNGQLQDPEHDLEFWKKMLNDPALETEAIYFVSLAGEEATRESIQASITQLFHNSEALGISDRAKLFVYLTGEGDQNRMCLPNEEYLSKGDIVSWLWQLRATWGYNRPMTLVLDICRNGDEQGTGSHRGIELISSCSAGQEAQAIRFKSEQDTPYSCFFLALVIASLESPTRTSASFKTDVERHLSQIVGLIRSKHASKGNSEGPGPQDPDWSQAGDGQNLSTFLELARMLSRTKLAREVREFILKGFPAEKTTSGFPAEHKPLPDDHTTHHLRGYGREPEQPPAKLQNGCTCHQAGRTAAIASGQLNCSDASSGPRTSSPSPSEAASDTHSRRGRQFPSQDFSLTPTPPPWKVKEPCTTPLGKDWMPSLTTMIGSLQFEEKSDSTDWQCLSTFESRANKPLSSSTFRARLHSVQAPPAPWSLANASDRPALKDPIVPGRLKQVKIKAKDRFIPYPNVRRRHRGLTPGTVETRQVGRKNSLETTLFGNPHLLQPDTVVWFILIVAVDYPGRDLQDPEHDLDFWRKMLNDPALDSETIYLIELAGKDATSENIKESLAQLYHDSEALVTIGRPNLFVYLTGEGDADQNRMHLLGGEFLSEEDIGRWLGELRTSCGYTRSITLVLDICRTNKDMPNAKMRHGVGLIYSSSPGEKAHALRFKSEQDTPYSSFMLAFVIASSVSPTSTTTEFVAAIEQRLGQLTRLIMLAASIKGDEDPGPQHPNWSQAGDLSTFLGLARMLSKTAVAREVHDFITQMPCFREENAASGSISKNRPSSEDRTSHHLRRFSEVQAKAYPRWAPTMCSFL